MTCMFAFLNSDGTWTEPKSLGKKINLPDYNEMTPYLAPDGVTLYFSSNRPGGLGDNDIWMTKRLDKTWQKWSDPVNLGQPYQHRRLGCIFYDGCRRRICVHDHQLEQLWRKRYCTGETVGERKTESCCAG